MHTRSRPPIGGNCHKKKRYIFRCDFPRQLPSSVGRWGLPLQGRHAFLRPTFEKSVVFNKLAKMTVENLCKMTQIANRTSTIAPRKWRLMTIFGQIATRNAPFSRKPLHCITG
nr:MAG TPA: hypothetical protein [Caudoviricetes sp.]